MKTKYAENIISSSAFWTIYEYAKTYDPENAAMYSSLAVPLFETPLDIIRKRQQLGTFNKLKTRQLMQYCILNYCINAIGNYLFVTTYKYIEKKDISFRIFPGLFVTTILYPLDLAKTNIIHRVSKEHMVSSYLFKCLYVTCYFTSKIEIMKKIKPDFL
jgi:hypothetical protein